MQNKKNVIFTTISDMETKIYWKEALEMIKVGSVLVQDDIDFKNEQIPVREVSFFNIHHIRVPEKLVFYDDDNIDTSDIPEISEADIESGKIQWINIQELKLDEELRAWIVQENINLNKLLPFLLNNFYQTLKFTRKNIAL